MENEQLVVEVDVNDELKAKKAMIKADLALFLVAILWGGGFITAKEALNCFTPYTIIALRLLGSGILMIFIFNKSMKYIPKHTWFSGITIGLLMFLGMALQTNGLNYTTASKQAFLISSYTVFVPFIAWAMTKVRPSLIAVLAGALTLAGVGVLSLTSNFSIQLGDALSLLFAVVFGLQIVCVGLFVKNVDMMQFTAIQMITGGVLALITALIFEAPPEKITLSATLSLTYLVVLSTTFAFTVQNVAQRYTTATHASIILSLQSIFGVFLAVLILKEEFTLRMGIGAIMIFGAVLISNFERK